MGFTPYIPGYQYAQNDQLIFTISSYVRGNYTTAFTGGVYIFNGTSGAFGYVNPQISYNGSQLNTWQNVCGWRLKNTNLPADDKHYLVLQFQPQQIVSETHYGYTYENCYGTYRYVLLHRGDNADVIDQVLQTYTAGRAAVRPYSADLRGLTIMSVDFYTQLYYKDDGVNGKMFGWFPIMHVHATDGDHYYYETGGGMYWGIPLNKLAQYGYGPELPDQVTNPYFPGGTSGEGGGGGDFDPTPDPIPLPSPLGDTALNLGFVTYYKVTAAQLEAMGAELFSDNAWDIVRNWFNDPMEMIAGLMLVPWAVTTGAYYTPKVGLHSFGVTLPLITQQFYKIDCGEILINPFYASSFDYSPFTSMDIYLPFVGVRSLDVDEIMGKYLGVTYNVDVMTGEGVAFITVRENGALPVTKSVRYQYPCQMGQQIPVSAANFDSVIQGAIGIATAAVGAIAAASTGGASAAAGAALASSTVSAVMNDKPRVEKSGSMGGVAGQMGVLKPFVIKKIPKQSLPYTYEKHAGFPSNISATVGSVTGYTVWDKIYLQGIAATDAELAKIEAIMKSGVIL